MKFDVKKIGMAFAGGALGGIAAEKYEQYQIDNGKEVNQKTTAILVAGLGAAIHYMGKGKLDALAMGMVGAAGADLGVQIMNEMGEESGAANGTPSQLSPHQMNGLRERVMEIRKRMGAGGGRKSVTAASEAMPGRTAPEGSFYTNPYTNKRLS